ncbi:hypothetical protein AKO1_005488, partial [Acrasis kona]
MTQVLSIAGPFIVSCPVVNNQCNGVNATNANVCSGRGSCSLTVCHCDEGFAGKNCEETAAQKTCTEHPVSAAPRSFVHSNERFEESSAALVSGLLMSVTVAIFAC